MRGRRWASPTRAMSWRRAGWCWKTARRTCGVLKMQEFAQQTLSGIASGSLFAILALAIVLIYRSTNVLNFAQGEMAMFTTFISWTFMTRMDFWPAFLLAALVAAPT